ncbi:DNA repair protein RadC [Ravibacter arvi]|uniref:DNA repair protein RadC n=1 Tax=Ravibacter arvi TaxID=2051041 RepID=A0ABP8LY19_9BACT
MDKISTSLSRNIRSWDESDRPREKLLQKGRNQLTDAELLAILLRSGTVSESALDVAKTLLFEANNSLYELARKSPQEIMRVKGIGEAKALTLIAAMELGRRRKDIEVGDKAKITSSRMAYETLRHHLQDKSHEEFWILLLNRANEVIRSVQVSSGGVNSTGVDSRIIFKHAIENLASAMILAHNHPSGTLSPSKEDMELTRKLSEAGKILSVPVLDHLIFTDHDYLSFADNGIL